MKKIIKDNIEINYSESLEELSLKTIELLKEKIVTYKKIFNITKLDTIKINYFDNIEEFRNFIYDIRKEKDTLPKYAKGTYDKGMINACIDEEDKLKRIYTAPHELFHILYMKHILKNNYKNRIVWFDEGLAQNYSGEKKKLDDENLFKKYYDYVKINTKIIPNLNEINHGVRFKNQNYNGYDLSFLAVRYLKETMNENGFIELMSNFKRIK